MATNNSDAFEQTFWEWQRQAGKLLDLDGSDETKALVKHQAEKFAELLRKKSEEELGMLEKSIKDEDSEVDVLKKRLNALRSSDSEEVWDRQGVLRMFERIYDKEWKDAFECLVQKSKSGPECVQTLLGILQECQRLTETKVKESQHRMAEVTLALSAKGSKKKPNVPPDVLEACRTCQKTSLHGSLPIIKQNIFEETRAEMKIQFPPKLSDKQETCLKAYTTRCIEVCLLMTLQFPDLKMTFDLKKVPVEKKDLPPKDRPLAWPAIVSDGKCLRNHKLLSENTTSQSDTAAKW